MPVEISWQQPGRVLYQRFYGAGVLEEISPTQSGFVQQLAESKEPIHVIIDLSGITEAPTSLADVRKRILFSDSQNLGHVVIVEGTNPVIRYYSSMLSQVVRKETPFKFVDSTEEAIQYLRERHKTVTLERIINSNA